MDIGATDVGGQVRRIAADGEILWVLADGPFQDATWNAYLGTERIAAYHDGSDQLAFSGARLYERVAEGAAGTIRRRRLAASTASNPALSLVLVETPTGVRIDGDTTSLATGGESIALFDAQSKLLPSSASGMETSSRGSRRVAPFLSVPCASCAPTAAEQSIRYVGA